MRITLSGDLGSGKSSVGRRLAAMLGIPHFSAGSLFREIGQIANLDALQTNLAAEDNAEIDYAVDNRTRELNQLHESFIIDSRMAWHFVDNAVRVYLSVAPETAAERITADPSRSGEAYPDLDSAIASLRERRDSEVRRYKRLYGTDITDTGNYDLLIVTDDAMVDDIAALILAFAEGRTREKFWLPKPRIVPMAAPYPAARRPAEPTRLGEGPLITAAVVRNFGFSFDDATTLLKAFAFELPLVPYLPTAAPDSGDIFAAAQRKLLPDHLLAWEKVSDVRLAFSRWLTAPAPG
jgi:predicted cytidylate kinase